MSLSRTCCLRPLKQPDMCSTSHTSLSLSLHEIHPPLPSPRRSLFPLTRWALSFPPSTSGSGESRASSALTVPGSAGGFSGSAPPLDSSALEHTLETIKGYYYLRIENAGRLCFDRRVFIYLFVYLFIYLFICMRVIRKTQKVLNRIA